jgi:HSP20 family protein
MFYYNSNHFDDLLKDAFKDWPTWSTTLTSTGNHYSEKTDDGYKLEIAVPGLTKEDLKVKIIKGRLNVKSEKENYWTSAFDKTFTLPEDADLKKVKASVENGILLVTIPVSKDSENIIEII